MKLFLIWGLVFGIYAGAARAEDRDFSLPRAEKMSTALLKFRREGHFLGVFRDRGDSGRIFDGVEAILNENLPQAPHRVLRVESESDGLRVVAKLGGHPAPVVLHAHYAREKIAPNSQALLKTALPAGQKKVSVAEALGLTVYESAATDNADRLYYTSVTREWTSDDSEPPLNGQIEAGARFKRFTLAVFSRQLLFPGKILNQNGLALAVPLADVVGFKFTAYIEGAYASESNVIISQGEVKQERGDAFNALFRLEVSKTWGYSGVTVAGGVKFNYFGAAGLDQEALKVAFLRVGKAFKNRAGKEIAAANILATQEFGRDRNRHMISLVLTRKF